MLKTVRIGNIDYNMKSSAFTMFSYKDKTGRNLLDDLNKIINTYQEIDKVDNEEEKNSMWMSELSSILENILKLTYVMIKEQNKDFKEYNEWLKELDNLFEDSSWVIEVVECGMSPFRGRIQNT